MDGGPRRSQSRSVINRSDSRSDKQPSRPVETTLPPAEPTPPPTAAPARVATRRHQEPTPGFFKKHWKALVVTLVVILAVAGAGAYCKMNAPTAIDSNKYQAVFFTNGQVYFGKLSPLNQDYMTLKDVYYLQSEGSTEANGSENPQDSTSDQSSMQLVKLGKEIHGPEDEMVISKDQMMFYENLKDDGKVASTIKKYQQGQ